MNRKIRGPDKIRRTRPVVRWKDVPPDQIAFGEILRKARHIHGHTLYSLGAETGICYKLICNIENAKNYKVNFRDVAVLADTLGLDLRHLAKVIMGEPK